MMAVSDEQEEKLIKLAIYAVSTVIIVFFLTIAGCTMHGNAYEADVERELTGQVIAQAEISKLKLKQSQDETAAIKALVDSGIHPLAARCAIKGYNGSTAGNLCLSAGAKLK
jgi:hypothetical protein